MQAVLQQYSCLCGCGFWWTMLHGLLSSLPEPFTFFLFFTVTGSSWDSIKYYPLKTLWTVLPFSFLSLRSGCCGVIILRIPVYRKSCTGHCSWGKVGGCSDSGGVLFGGGGGCYGVADICCSPNWMRPVEEQEQILLYPVMEV